MRELVNLNTSCLIELGVKIRKYGKNVAKNEASTHRLPMTHELIMSAQDSFLELSSQSNIQVSFKFILRSKERV